MVRRILFVSFIIASFFISQLWAQSDKDKLLQMPEGKLIMGLIKAFNSGNAEVMRDFIKSNYSESNLKRNPVDSELLFFQQFYNTNREMKFHSLFGVKEHMLTILVQAKLSERWLIFQFLFNTEAPYKIERLRIGSADAPPEFALKEKMTEAEIAAELDRLISKLAQADTFSGTVLLAKDEKIIFKKAYGLASKRFNIPNKIDTKFNLGSMNKMFTGLAIVQLAEQGKLSFDDPIIKHVPDYPNKEVAQKVTIHHLFTHTSGMGHFWNEKFDDEFRWLRTVEDHIPLFVDDPLAFEPGERWSYSNAGFVVLGLIIERITGQSYYDYVKKNIFEPAGMMNTDSYEMDKPVPNLAIGYTKLSPDEGRFTGEWRNNHFIHRIKGGPAGGGFSTVEDMHKFALALRNHKLLSQKYGALILTGIAEISPKTKYAYGFGESTIKDYRFIGHTGGTAGVEAIFRTSPDSGYTFIILSNYDNSTRPVSAKMRDLIARFEE